MGASGPGGQHSAVALVGVGQPAAGSLAPRIRRDHLSPSLQHLDMQRNLGGSEEKGALSVQRELACDTRVPERGPVCPEQPEGCWKTWAEPCGAGTSGLWLGGTVGRWD